MRRLAALTALTTTLALASAGVTSTVATAAAPAAGTLRAGAAVVDDTWHVGASAGQYGSEPDTPDPSDPSSVPGTVTSDAGTALANEWDPNVQSVKKAPSYGVA